MYKEKIQKVIIESYLNDKMDSERFIRMTEKVENISEKRAEEILTEIDWKAVAVGGGLSLAVLLGIWAETEDRKRRFDSDWKICRDKCLKTFAPKIKRAKETGIFEDTTDLREDYEECKDKCSEIYFKKVEVIKKKQKEIKDKIKKAKEEIKKRKAAGKK